ncbi:MAG: CheB methylesterase domain-containing protein [Defluviitaleaceae bacterium]|nr:CheB methylesterase domain-containing protein [Defluviitaleaceae bacterium]MCL2264379.1 CheB methylesterase domain-containing protein [Defluviitaleaceae bacterium]
MANQKDLVAAIKTGLENRKDIESVLTVTGLSSAETKLNRNGVNILFWDLDEIPADHNVTKSMQRRCTLYTIYVSLSRGKYAHIPSSGNDIFLQKPAVFTSVTTWRFTTSSTEILDTMLKRQRPPNMREMVKMVGVNDRQKIVAIGSSTGGTNALEDIIKKLPADIPPIVIVQHMPSGFTKLFAERLNSLYIHDIREAHSGDFLMRGRILIAPADRHMRLVRQQDKLAVECYVGQRIHGVMPAADILFESVAGLIGARGVGVILTGMGNDGAKGLVHMKNAGSVTIGQDEASCVVYGMPKAAKALGAVAHELPLDQIADAIMLHSR